MSDSSQIEREKVLLAALTGTNANPNWLTSDMVDALLGGHGMLNIAIFNIADVIVSEMRRGTDTDLHLVNAPTQPLDEVLKKTINVAIKAGCDPANAALLSASMLYLTGTKAQVGIPAGNRKLGASARMIAGVDRCGVAAIPTAKRNNKVSGFAAVMAIHQAMLNGELCDVSGYDVVCSGGGIIGHSRLGEDIIFPSMAENGARIGTQAMMDTMAGAGMNPSKFNAALFGAAAILEIIHPDADVAEKYGPHGKVTSAYIAGKVAAETAGLPDKLHVRITGQEYETGQVIGDLGLILKDIGGPSVIGIMALGEIVGVFEEGIAGASAGPINPPLGHVAADAVIAMKCLLEEGANQPDVSAALKKRRYDGSFDPETSMIAMNVVAKKAAQLQAGAVTNSLILASEPVRAQAVYRRAVMTYEYLSEGKGLEEVVHDLDKERQELVEANVSQYLSEMSGKDVKIRLTYIGPGARRKSKLAKQWLAFDAHLDFEIVVDGETTILERFSDQVIPDIATGKRRELAWAAQMAEPLANEMLLASNVVLNITVPATVAAAMGKMTPKEAGTVAQGAGFVTAGIPGSNANAEAAGKLAIEVMNHS